MALRNLDGAEGAETARLRRRQLDPVRHAAVRFDCEYRLGRVLDVGISSLDAVDRQAVVSHLYRVPRQADHALHKTGFGGF